MLFCYVLRTAISNGSHIKKLRLLNEVNVLKSILRRKLPESAPANNNLQNFNSCKSINFCTSPKFSNINCGKGRFSITRSYSSRSQHGVGRNQDRDKILNYTLYIGSAVFFFLMLAISSYVKMSHDTVYFRKDEKPYKSV